MNKIYNEALKALKKPEEFCFQGYTVRVIQLPDIPESGSQSKTDIGHMART